MSTLDLSSVTQSLMTLLQENINRRLEPGLGVSVTPQAPDSLSGQTNRISLYLYHSAEEPSFKNAPVQGSGRHQVASTPLALCLYYILTAHHDASTPETDTLQQQKIFGYALKTLHDFPLVDERTEVAPLVPVLHPNLRGRDNRLEIIHRPVTPEEALAFWSSEENTTRLSAYYEVRVVLLDPEPLRFLPGIVLSLGAYPIPRGAPHLERSGSVLAFDLPARASGLSRRLSLSPARVAALAGGPSDAPFNRVELRGEHLQGRRASLWLRHSLWARRSPPLDRMEASADPTWNVEIASDRVRFEVQPTLASTSGSLPVLPGIYSAYVRVVHEERALLNSVEEIAASSNEIVFAIAPRILSHDPPDLANARITLRLAPSFALDAPELDEAVQLSVMGRAYRRVPSFGGGAADAGSFVVASHSLTFQSDAPLLSGDLAIRLMVSGVDARPFWVEVP